MRLSRYFLPVLKENPAEAQIVSHRYMLRAGMIKQQAAGIYSWLPLGYRALKRIETIVHEEQQRAGHIPLLMPTLQPADLWRESGRYEDYGQEMLRIRDRLYQTYAKSTGQSIDRIAKDCDRNKWLDENEMLEYGLVDKVLTKMTQIKRDPKASEE